MAAKVGASILTNAMRPADLHFSKNQPAPLKVSDSSTGSRLEMAPDDPYTLSIKAAVLIQKSKRLWKNHKPLKSIECLQEAANIYRAKFSQGAVKDHRNRDLIDRIIFCFETMQQIEPRILPYNLAEAHMVKAGMRRFSHQARQWHWTRAREVCRQIIFINPFDFRAHLWKSRCSLALGRIKESLIEICNASTIADGKNDLQKEVHKYFKLTMIEFKKAVENTKKD